MANKPNKMGRIEAEPKVKKQLPWKSLGTIVLGLALVAAGIVGTLKYQGFINDVKSQGVAEYQSDKCNKYSNKENTQTWLECDVVRNK